eukprot:CAMPEP_0116879640 /NCGR_PEP_ID=MMETSP0463-20121206/11457_1 /TAXON_ID=181622 /ORGANISM="Strombidinopsis sp, Strain SopsisLIS2011" /LENGTH=141 /DNA_ID=CAMNT_0004529197 /DNA_START=25 /DNA_END=450 /DNA_ORIENTATION=-
MTTITEKITLPLEIINRVIEEPSDFEKMAVHVRNNLLQNNAIDTGLHLDAFGDDQDEMFQAIECLAYIIIHIAKINATEEEFEAIFLQTMLKPAFKKGVYKSAYARMDEIREFMQHDNNRGIKKFKDMDWRLGMVMACRNK